MAFCCFVILALIARDDGEPGSVRGIQLGLGDRGRGIGLVVEVAENPVRSVSSQQDHDLPGTRAKRLDEIVDTNLAHLGCRLHRLRFLGTHSFQDVVIVFLRHLAAWKRRARELNELLSAKEG